ncbi:MAG TPA: thioredoxin family protein [Clostridiales bacterium]|nr:thioredoxin family protein [Clostridiales bacterium]
MSLFEKKEKSCCCGGNCNDETMKAAADIREKGAKAKILGGGCAKCNALEAATIQALTELGLDTMIDHVKDYTAIASYGVMTTPALVYNGKVLSYGKVLKVDEVKKLLEKEV